MEEEEEVASARHGCCRGRQLEQTHCGRHLRIKRDWIGERAFAAAATRARMVEMYIHLPVYALEVAEGTEAAGTRA